MEKVNYIIQLNAVLEMFNNDDRIKQGHITLYIAFFNLWNRKFFKEILIINRELIMDRAKIKSKTTYHNHLRDLDAWGYLTYYPSYHPSRGSKIRITRACPKSGTTSGTQEVQNLDNFVPEPSQNLVSSYKHKTKENFNKLARPKNELEVFEFFKKNSWPEKEGRKFYAYYETKNWKLSRGLNIQNWKESAKNFVKKGFTIKEEYISPINGYVDRLFSKKKKDYGQPL